MVRMIGEHYCYNIYCLYQWCDRCSATDITIDADGRCASCVPLRLTKEELKERKQKYYGIELEEPPPYCVKKHEVPDEWKPPSRLPTVEDIKRLEKAYLDERLHRYGRKEYPKKKRVRKK